MTHYSTAHGYQVRHWGHVQQGPAEADRRTLAVLDGARPRLLTQGGQGGPPGPLASRLHRAPTHFPLNLRGI